MLRTRRNIRVYPGREKTVGNEKLVRARKKMNMTQVQVASKAGIGERLYQNYEYGIFEPGVRTAIRIAKTLGSTVEELFGTDLSNG